MRFTHAATVKNPAPAGFAIKIWLWPDLEKANPVQPTGKWPPCEQCTTQED